MQSDSSAAIDDPLASSQAAQPATSPGNSGHDADGQEPSSLKSKRAARDKDEASTEKLRRRIYDQPDLSNYGLRDRIIIRAAGMFFYLLIGVICSTLRWEVRGSTHLDSIVASGHRAIFTFWHTCIFSATWFWRKRGIVVMSSQSRDAEYTSRFIRRFGYGATRGSATRGGRQALREMSECLMSGIDVAFTIDGPRGPAYVAKPGAITLARHTGQAILPFHIAARRRIELSSWDRLQIPLPFTRAAAFIAEPIYVPRDASKDEIAQKQSALQSSLDQLRIEAEIWLAE